MTFDNAIESFASIDWYLCPPLSFRASMSGFCLSAGCNQASHAARSPSLAARHITFNKIRLPNAQILMLWPWADVHLVRFSSGYPRRFFSSESSCRLQINCWVPLWSSKRRQTRWIRRPGRSVRIRRSIRKIRIIIAIRPSIVGNSCSFINANSFPVQNFLVDLTKEFRYSSILRMRWLLMCLPCTCSNVRMSRCGFCVEFIIKLSNPCTQNIRLIICCLNLTFQLTDDHVGW